MPKMANKIEHPIKNPRQESTTVLSKIGIVVAAVSAGCAGAWSFGYSPLRGVVQGIDYLARVRESHIVIDNSISGEKITLRRDPSGLVQIQASSIPDLLYGQGYAHGMDRLFQLEILRRVALGEMSAAIGDKAIPLDKWHRTMGFQQLAEEDWKSLQENHPKTAKELTSYVAGLNAYLSERDLKSLNLPVDLLFLKIKPRLFTEVDSLAFQRWHTSAMNKGWQNELVYAKLMANFDKELISSLQEALDYESEGNLQMGATLNKFAEYNEKKNDVDIPMLFDNGGSNAWVVSGKMTASGMPIMANDPHLPFTLPAAWHAASFNCDEEDVHHTGISIPLMPYIVAGHNRHVAHGVTLGRCDVDDIFFEKVNKSTNTYLDSDGTWKPLTTRTESIKVKGQKDPITIEVSETRRGPLVCHLLQVSEECSLSSLVLQKQKVFKEEFGGASMHSLRDIMMSKSVPELMNATSGMAVAQLNMVMADSSNNIGYHMTGRVPKREIFDGPREGWNPDHQWNGWVPFNEMPHALNPESGFIVSANQKPHIDSASSDANLGNIWQHGWRAKRIEELLVEGRDSQKLQTVLTTQLIQRDIVSIPGRRMAASITKLEEKITAANPSTEVSSALSALRNWDGSMHQDSAAAAVYATFKDIFLKRVLVSSFVDPSTVDQILGVGYLAAGKMGNDLEGRHGTLLLKILDQHPATLPLVEATSSSLVELIADSLQETARDLGPDADNWKWGSIHTASFNHPFGKAGFPLDHMFSVNIGPSPGDVDTVALAAYLHQSVEIPGLPLPKPRFQQRGFAASSRIVVDFGNPKDTVVELAPGNSGRQSSPFYSDKKDILNSDPATVPITTTSEDHPLEVEIVKERPSLEEL
eukprot:TRINITY_DN4054_c0_g3_i1.p1 TRINITY_DN4054_c0_g3~~TRINITY_DN4054_c0_g3_i1.p1  ORF type:complete len:896 (+),score=167.94 TRINITY_DN4054_c0_g3_i1:84-2690(+)